MGKSVPFDFEVRIETFASDQRPKLRRFAPGRRLFRRRPRSADAHAKVPVEGLSRAIVERFEAAIGLKERVLHYVFAVSNRGSKRCIDPGEQNPLPRPGGSLFSRPTQPRAYFGVDTSVGSSVCLFHSSQEPS